MFKIKFKKLLKVKERIEVNFKNFLFKFNFKILRQKSFENLQFNKHKDNINKFIKGFKSLTTTNEDRINELFKDKDFLKIFSEIQRHNEFTKDKENEYLTVINKKGDLVCNLKPGKYGTVEIPKKVFQEAKNNGILVIIHNHYGGAIIPSYGDMYYTLKLNSKFLVITSEDKEGIIVNNILNNSNELFYEFLSKYRDYESYINYQFNSEYKKELTILEDSINERNRLCM